MKTAPEPTHFTSVAAQDELLSEFFALVHASARGSRAAITAAKPALARIAAAIAGRDNGQALRLRSLLFSLYSGRPALADLSDVMTLDWSLRRDLCTVLLAFGFEDFAYENLRATFRAAAPRGDQWFLAAEPTARERLDELLAFARPGPLALPRSRGEAAAARLLVALFDETPTEIHAVLMALDRPHGQLALAVLADYAAERFNDDDRVAVSRHFQLEP